MFLQMMKKKPFFGYWIFNIDIVFRIQYSIITLSDTIGRKHYLFSLDNRIRFIEILKFENKIQKVDYKET